MIITHQQFKNYLFRQQGLSGRYLYDGIEGTYDYIDNAGCIQYDPVDVVGRNADITLQSRVSGYSKEMLDQLLYKRRDLVDGFDKMMSIYPAKYWHHMKHQRVRFHEYTVPFEETLVQESLDQLKELEVFTTNTLEIEGDVAWGYGRTPLARALMDYHYYKGDIIIHHKEGTQRYFTHRHLYFDEDRDEFDSLEALHEWYVYRRIGAAGALWNKSSDAFLGIPNFKQANRNKAFHALMEKGAILELNVEGIDTSFYIRSKDSRYLKQELHDKDLPRLELLAPLDPFMWDRKLISKVFEFDYKWEIYTPKEKRKFGHYTLPVVYDAEFVGRVQLVINDGYLKIDSLWNQPGKKVPKRILNAKLKEFAQFNNVKFTNRK